jgi:hypothetical protein
MSEFDTKTSAASTRSVSNGGGKAPGKRTLTQRLPPSPRKEEDPVDPASVRTNYDPPEDPFKLHLGGKSHVLAPTVATFQPTIVGVLAKLQQVSIANLTGEEVEVATVEEAEGSGEFWYMGRAPTFKAWGGFVEGSVAFNPKQPGPRHATLLMKDVDGHVLGEINVIGMGVADIFKSNPDLPKTSAAEKKPEEEEKELTEEEKAAFWAKFKEVEEEPPPINPVEVDEMTDRLVMAGMLLSEGHGEEADALIAQVIRWKHQNLTDGHVKKMAGGYDMGTQQVYAFLYAAEEAVYEMHGEALNVRRGNEFSAKWYEIQLKKWGLSREAMAVVMGYLPAGKSNMVLISRQGGKVARDLGIIGMTAPFFLRNPAAQVGSLARGLAWFGGTRVGAPIAAGGRAAMGTLPGRAMFGGPVRTAATLAAGTNLATQVAEHGSDLEDYNLESVAVDYAIGAVSGKIVHAIVAQYPARVFNAAEWAALGKGKMLLQIGKQQGTLMLYGVAIGVARSQVANTDTKKQVTADRVESALQGIKATAIESWLATDEGKQMFPNGRKDPRVVALSQALGVAIKWGVRDAFDVVPQSDLKERE